MGLAAGNLIRDAVTTIQQTDVIGSADKDRLLAQIGRYWDSTCGRRSDCCRCNWRSRCLDAITDLLGS